MKKGWRALVGALCFLACAKAGAFMVSNAQISDDAGHQLQLNAVNWFGFDDAGYAPHGLWTRKWADMISQMKANGVNAVRIPLCPNAIHGAAVTVVNYNDNPDLQGLNSLQILDKLVAAFDAAGIYVLLDFHVPDANGISELWYTSDYTEAQWIGDLTFLANRYGGVKHVLGMDLKNEPHGAATWGTGNVATDWNLAAQRAATPVMAAAPEWLMFVEGIQDNPNNLCQSSLPHFWGENLEPMACTPLTIPANKLVLAPHVYGPDISAQAYFSASNFPANMPAVYDTIFGFLKAQGYAIVPTEFGGQYMEGVAGEDAFETNFISYMKGKGLTNVFYWAWNGNGWPNGGLLETDWTTINPNKLALMQSLWSAGPTPIANPVTGATLPTVTFTASPASITIGQASTLAWSSTNATSCTTTGTGWVSGIALPTSGSFTTGVAAYAGSLSLGLTCTGAGGSGTASVTLTITSAAANAPSVKITITPATITVGQSATITWTSSNASACTTSGTGWANGYSFPTSGTVVTGVAAYAGALNLGLTCTGSTGSSTGAATLTISAK